MKFSCSVILAALLSIASPSPIDASTPDSLPPNTTIFTPPSTWANHATSYARTVYLEHETHGHDALLATWTFSPPGRPYAPIFQSTDGGLTWTNLSKAYFPSADKAGAIILQTFLYELPHPLGRFPAGTVLLAANSVPADFSSTNIEVLVSYDRGQSFEFLSTVAVGTAPDTDNGAHPIWEPMILMHESELGIFYSDQRDPLHGQKLAHQTSRDLLTWGPVINDAAETNYTLRPGMTSITKMGNGQFIFMYEEAFAQEDPVNAPYAVHYRVADSPFEFGGAKEMLLKARDGTVASAGPQVVWTAAGGENGTVVVSDSTNEGLFINRAFGEEGMWEMVESGKGVGYTRTLKVMPHTDGEVILVTNGGMYGEKETIVSCGNWTVPAY